MDAAIIEKEAMNLPDSERAVLADRLISSLRPVPEDLKEAWVSEADSRMEGFRDGEISAIDGPEAMADLKARFTR